VTDIVPSKSIPPGARSSSTALALVVTLALALVVVLVVITLSYSNHNTPASVNGTTVTSSHYEPAPQ
jgi:hypothetical protein